MRNDIRCNCHICEVERHLFDLLTELPGSIQFLKMAASSLLLAKFTNISELLAYLHSPRTGDYASPNATELLTALITIGATAADTELIHSVLVLAFAPTIHRLHREVSAWFRELEPEDIAQQILTFFLELVVSATVENLIGLLPIALSRSLRKNSFRWAAKEKRALLKRQAEMQADTRNDEPAAEDRFETAFILYDFLDYCSQNGILSTFERDLLIKVKMDGFEVKELLNRHTVLSPKAVYVRIQRIMKRLQEATTMPPPDRELAQDREIKQRRKDRKSSQSMSTFCLSNSTDFLPISKSRRQLSLDSSAMRSGGKRQHLRP